MQGSYKPVTADGQYGLLHPWTVMGYGDDTWQAVNVETGAKLGRHKLYSEALKEARNAKEGVSNA